MQKNTLIAAVIMGMLLTQGLVRSEPEFTFTAAKCDNAAEINGVAKKGEYPSQAMAMKQTPERSAIQGQAARARAFHDCKTLYVTITVPFKAGTALSKGEGWGQNDGAEVCLRDASGAKPGSTFIIHGYASGKHECTTEGGAASDKVEKLDKAVKFAARAGKQSWTGEWAIPLDAIDISYKPGLSLGFNVGAWRSESGEWIVWRGAQGPTYDLDNGGKLILE
ncbi:MAG: hypothetical protein PHI84_14805 [Kiritimatiellae bacterium]|nr:hypothetical protein [Kiritimatiellia bacterium]